MTTPPTDPQPIGWAVMVLNHKTMRWDLDWDGELHRTEEAARQECRSAFDAGYTSCYGAFVPAGDVSTVNGPYGETWQLQPDGTYEPVPAGKAVTCQFCFDPMEPGHQERCQP